MWPRLRDGVETAISVLRAGTCQAPGCGAGAAPCGGDDLGRSDERGACSLARDGGRPAMSPGGPACAPVGAGPAGCVCDLDGRRAAKRRSVYGSKNTGTRGWNRPGGSALLRVRNHVLHSHGPASRSPTRAATPAERGARTRTLIFGCRIFRLCVGSTKMRSSEWELCVCLRAACGCV